MEITRISSTQYLCSSNYIYKNSATIFNLTFYLNKNINRRTAYLSNIRLSLKDNNFNPDSSIFNISLDCVNYLTGSILVDTISGEYNASTLRDTVDLASYYYTTSYDGNGELSIALKLNINGIINVINLHDEDELKISPEYTKPEIKISNYTGTSIIGTMEYLNVDSLITVEYSENSESNNCEETSSFIGLKFVKSGTSSVIKDYVHIKDNSGSVSFNASISNEDEISNLDDSYVYIYAIRTDSINHTSIDEKYIGKFHILPKFISKEDIKLSLAFNSLASYDILDTAFNDKMCISFCDRTKQYRIKIDNYNDKIIGKKSGFSFNIYNGSYMYQKNSEYNVITSSISNVFDLTGSKIYHIVVKPYYLYNNSKYYSSNELGIQSISFKVLDYPRYTFDGLDTASSLGEFNTKYSIDSDPFNLDYNATINANHEFEYVMAYDCPNLTILSCKLVLLYNMGSEKVVKAVGGLGTCSVLDYVKRSELLNSSYYLVLETSCKLENESGSYYQTTCIQYVGRVCYQPIQSLNYNKVEISYINNKSVGILINDDRFTKFQLGIVSKYRIIITDTLNEETIVDYYTDDNNNQIIINSSKFSNSLKPNIEYNIKIYQYYSENDNNYITIYNSGISKIFINADSPGIPSIAYPRVPSLNENNIWYSFNGKSMHILFTLPELIEGSGTASSDNEIYDDIRFSINNDIDGDNSISYSTNKEYFIGTFKYKGKMIIQIDTTVPIGECVEENEYIFRLQVHQNWNNVNQWGEIAEIRIYGYTQDELSVRQDDYDNNIITIDRINDATNILKGICKSYSATDIDSILSASYLPYKSGDKILAKEFIDIYNVYKEVLNGLVNWCSGNSKIMSITVPNLNINPNDIKLITKSDNYIEKQYNYYQNTIYIIKHL